MITSSGIGKLTITTLQGSVTFIKILSLDFWSLKLLNIFLWHQSFTLLLIFLINSIKSYRKILWSMTNVIELIIYKLYLFC